MEKYGWPTRSMEEADRELDSAAGDSDPDSDSGDSDPESCLKWNLEHLDGLDGRPGV